MFQTEKCDLLLENSSPAQEVTSDPLVPFWWIILHNLPENLKATQSASHLHLQTNVHCWFLKTFTSKKKIAFPQHNYVNHLPSCTHCHWFCREWWCYLVETWYNINRCKFTAVWWHFTQGHCYSTCPKNTHGFLPNHTDHVPVGTVSVLFPLLTLYFALTLNDVVSLCWSICANYIVDPTVMVVPHKQ